MRGLPMRCDRNRLFLNADFASVRDTLIRLFPPADVLDDDSRAVAELVLAEVLNNVVEHAYGGAGGRIDLSLRLGAGWIAFRVADAGMPYPANALPDARDELSGSLAEGGFGWGLIRALATGIAYRRAGRLNVLVFRIPVNISPLAA